MGMRTRSAGEEFGFPWGIWGSYTRNSLENDFAATAFDSDTISIQIRADF